MACGEHITTCYFILIHFVTYTNTCAIFYNMFTGSSFIVLVSFVWGIFVFGEPIHSRASACFAILCMMLGLFGMSCYSSPQKAPITIIDTSSRQGVGAYQSLGSSDDGDRTDVECTGTVTETDNDSPEKSLELADHPLWVTAETTHSSIDIATSREESTFSVDVADPPTASISPPPHAAFKVHITKSELGMMSAAFCGIWGGSIMAPMKFCKANTKGTHYLLSFSIGASIVTVALWFLRYTYHAVRCRSVVKAFECLPSFHLRVMWRPGGLSGLLWSIGNFFSMISVFYLGEAVGYPLVQTSILFAGLWGIFYFKEVQGIVQITKWLLSSLLTIFGILLLSYEHHQK